MKFRIAAATLASLALSTTLAWATGSGNASVTQKVEAKSHDIFVRKPPPKDPVVKRLAGVTKAVVGIRTVRTEDGTPIKSAWLGGAKFGVERNAMPTADGKKTVWRFGYPWGQTTTSNTNERSVDEDGAVTEVQHHELSTQRKTPTGYTADRTAVDHDEVRVERDGTRTVSVSHADSTAKYSYSDSGAGLAKHKVAIVEAESTHKPGEKNLHAAVASYGYKQHSDGGTEKRNGLTIANGIVTKNPDSKSPRRSGPKSLAEQQHAFDRAASQR